HRRRLTSTLFPYTTLFRSVGGLEQRDRVAVEVVAPQIDDLVVGLADRERIDRHLPEPCAERSPGRPGIKRPVHVRILAGIRSRQDRKSTRLNSSHLGISYA